MVTMALVLKPASSVTVKVMTLLPVWLGAGVTVSVRSEFVPMTRRFAFGITLGLEELVATTNRLPGVRSSETEIANDDVAFEMISQLVATVRVGGWFCGM